ncbi:hypothetical protein [Streptomyces sp. NPDC060184]|uniref:hypothetical protein n=1 Tax=Streptomyces sp. NPDC060184 TaxID=3347064 RepID=UPI003661102A
MNLIPSSDRSADGLPFSLAGRFRPWRFGVSHTELVLRSVARPNDDDVVELVFRGVIGMTLKSAYDSVVLAEASDARAAEILRFTGVAGRPQAQRVRCLTLEPESEESFVACVGFSVWSYPVDGAPAAIGKSRTDGTLLFRQ